MLKDLENNFSLLQWMGWKLASLPFDIETLLWLAIFRAKPSWLLFMQRINSKMKYELMSGLLVLQNCHLPLRGIWRRSVHNRELIKTFVGWARYLFLCTSSHNINRTRARGMFWFLMQHSHALFRPILHPNSNWLKTTSNKKAGNPCS